LEKVQRLGYTACNHRDGFLRCYGETAYSPGGTVPRGMAMKSIGAEVPSKYPTTVKVEGRKLESGKEKNFPES